MPIIATRLVNPPSKRRKSKRYPTYAKLTKPRARARGGIRIIHTPSGVRYMRGGRFVASVKVKAARRRRVGRRNPASEALKARLAAVRAAGFDVAGAAAKARAKAAKRRKKTTTRRKTVAKKRRMPPRTKSGRFRKVKRAKTTRRRKTTRRKATTRKRTYRSRPRRNPAATNPTRRRRRARRRRNPMVPLVNKHGRQIGVSLSRTRSSKSRRYRVTYTKKIRNRRRWAPGLKRVGRNPMATLKRSLPIYGGILAIRIVSGLLKKYVADKYMTTLGAAAPYVPAGLAFLFATLAAPKIKAIANNQALLQGIQLGATVALGDVVIKNLIQKPMLASQTELVQVIGGSLAGYDDLGVQGYGAYIADPTGYSLPAAHRTVEPGVGLDAHEAMALDEYVSDVGYDVNEALAGTEADYIQRGGAGGSLSKTVFSS